MNQPLDQQRWWELHLRLARGETLSEPEQQLYDTAVTRQDQEAPPLKSDLETLKAMRQHVLALTRDNTELRRRASELELQIHLVEAALSRETREVLGVEQ